MGRRHYNMTILLVEDDLFLQESIGAVLRYLNCEVYVAKEGEEALLLFQKHCAEIDLVLMESSLPGFDSEVTLVAMHSINPNLRVLILTPDLADMGFFRDLPGVCGQLTKPFSATELARRISLIVWEDTQRSSWFKTMHSTTESYGAVAVAN